MLVESKLSAALTAFDLPCSVLENSARCTITAIFQTVPFITAAIAANSGIILVTATEREAENTISVLEQSLGIAVDYFPAWETFPYERLSPAPDTVGARHKIIHKILTDYAYQSHKKTVESAIDVELGQETVELEKKTVDLGQRSVELGQESVELERRSKPVIITTIRALMQPIIISAPVPHCTFTVGQEHDFDDCKSLLISLGYEVVDLVSRPGEIAFRGGIIDIFPTTSEFPVRCEFFGDEIYELRSFSPNDQRSDPHDGENELRSMTIYPAKELIVTDDTRAVAQNLLTAGNLPEYTAQVIAQLAQGIYTPGVESLAGVLTGHVSFPLLTELIPDDYSLICVDPEKLHRRAEDIVAASQEFYRSAWETVASASDAEPAHAPLAADGREKLLDVDQILERSSQRIIYISAFDDSYTDYRVPIIAAPTPRGNTQELELLAVQWRKKLGSAWTIAIIVGSEFASTRVIQMLAELGIPGVKTQQLGLGLSAVQVIVASLTAGWVSDSAQIIMLTDYEFTGINDTRYSGKQHRKTKAIARKRIDPLSLSRGDLVVHDQHGIGKFIELTSRSVSGSMREYIVLEYSSNKRSGSPDRLYVPMESLDQLSRYVGGASPALSKLGGSDWQNTKRAARKAVRDIADKLVQLYAKRQSARGFAFTPDTPWQREFEDKFPYMETSDQLVAIDDIKADMEKPIPMDRVIVGDVGYGKTEVAMRAAFKAVQDGKQVAVLVPTTLLADQHLATFTERMQGFPMKIAGLSRFTEPREVKKILAAIPRGEVDIVIGTHRLLQTGVSWKDLGLVIIDEEQRFGVEHKEYITSLRAHVDMLTLSATPIPRTLEMSLSGIREMSTILTPPVDRHPILTYVGSYEDKLVAAAISRELLRDGQVFYVHNKVSTIDKAARKIRELVPEAKVAIAHGQMSEEILEKTVEGFWNREYDVLVCTTIVETGLDISNANTLIVENSEHLGLSQLHQLRGRVGRSKERAYAYFLYSPSKALTQTAYDRLATIAHNNELGAGMAVAMKDLEIRGAGNVLGAEQSGHIAGVGFDLYVRLVSEAVQAYRNIANGAAIEMKEQIEIRLDIPVDAHIPSEYIASERLRLSAYKTLAVAKNNQDLITATEELIDRYGEPPDAVCRLLALAQLRLLCQEIGIQEITVAGVMIKLSPIELADSAQIRLKRIYPQIIYRPVTQTLTIPLPRTAGMGSAVIRDEEIMQFIADLLAVIAGKPQGSVVIGDYVTTAINAHKMAALAHVNAVSAKDTPITTSDTAVTTSDTAVTTSRRSRSDKKAPTGKRP